MEPYFYEKDFGREPAPEPEKPFSLRKLLEENGLGEKPYMQPREEHYEIDPQMKENFDRLLPMCETFAEHWGGHLKATIDYDKHDAYIVVSGLQFFDFCLEDERRLLSEIALLSRGVTFSRDDNQDMLRLSIYFPYMRPVISEAEELQQLEELYEATGDILRLFGVDPYQV